MRSGGGSKTLSTRPDGGGLGVINPSRPEGKRHSWGGCWFLVGTRWDELEGPGVGRMGSYSESPSSLGPSA